MNNTDVIVSIIIPVYRTEPYIRQCIESCLAQTYPQLDIILVDDGSPDQCPYLCDLYAAQYENIRVIHKKNEGAAFARKAGLDAALGKYVLFLDGDDWLDSNTVAECVNRLHRDNADCVMFGYVREYPDKCIANPLFADSLSYNRIQSENNVHRRIVGLIGEDLQEPHKVDNLSAFWGRLMYIDVARKGRFVSDREIGTSEDTIFNLYALDGCKISYINHCFYHYRKSNAQSITTAYKPDLAEKWDVMYDVIQEYIAGSGKAEEYHIPFLNRVACGMIGLGLNEVGSSENLFKKSAKIRCLLNKPLYKDAFKQLNISYCSLKWKIFFLLCKARAAFPLTVLLEIMNYLRSRVAA